MHCDSIRRICIIHNPIRTLLFLCVISLAIMALQKFISRLAFNRCALFVKVSIPLLTIHSSNLFCQMTSCFTLYLLPSICSVGIKFSKLCFLVMYPSNFSYLFPILYISVPFFCHFLKCSSFITRSVIWILCIILQNKN